MVAIFQILYYVIWLSMLLMSLFVVFHIVFYAYSFVSKIAMLAIFVPVVSVLLFTNLLLFSVLPLERIFASMLP
jgi:hypothetical protein